MKQASAPVAYIYVIQPDQMLLWKIGHTRNPIERLNVLQGQTPHIMRFVRVLMVETKHHATAFERYSLSWLNPHRSHGEWLDSLDAVNAQMDEICPAVDVTGDFAGVTCRRKGFSKPIPLSDLDRLIWRAEQYAAGVAPFNVSDHRPIPNEAGAA